MPNSIINNTIITRNALGIYLNENSLVKTINTKYGDEFGKGRNGDGKIGMTLDIRMPNDFVLRRGVNAAPQAITETFQPLTITQQNGADFGFTTAERTLKIEDFNKRYTKPAVNTILGGVATDIMSMTLGFQNMVRNADPTTGATLNPTANTWLRANAKLEKQNAPKAERWAVLDPDADAATVSGLMGLFNPAGQIGEQTRDGHMGSRLLGLEGWMMDQTILTQQTGSYAGGSTITAVPAQGANVLQVTALNGGLNAGDVITVANCYQVNRVTKQNYYQLIQFVVQQTVASGATSIPVGPAIIGPKVDIGDGTGTAVAHQNVAAMPAVGAAVSLVGVAGEVTRRNIMYPAEAMTLACVDLELYGGGVIDEGRASQDTISIRTVTYPVAANDVKSTRMDVLYGWGLLRPEWGVIVPSPITQ